MLERDGDDVTLLNIMGAAVMHHNEANRDLVNTIFMSALSAFAEKEDTRWVNVVSTNPAAELLFCNLRPDQADAVFASLIPHPRIDDPSEEILTSLAQRWPEKVVSFFGERLKFAQTREANERYEAIPFRLHDLQRRLSKIPQYVVDSAKAWFEEADGSRMYGDSRLPSVVFPEPTKELEDKLGSLVCSGDKRNFEFVISIMRSYQGQAVLRDLLKEIVEVLAFDDPLLDEIEAVVESTGVVTGEFGFVAAYEQKKTQIEPWLTDPRAKVRSFAERQLRSLDRQIAVEQRRSEERLALRKRSTGEHGDEEAL